MNQKTELNEFISTIKQIVTTSSSTFLQNFSQTHPLVIFKKQNRAPEDIMERSKALALDVAQATSDSEDNFLTWIHNYASNRWNGFANDYHSIRHLVSKREKIVDAGAAPYILSALLNQDGHEIIPLDIDPGRHLPVIELLNLTPRQCALDKDRWPVESDSCSIVIMNEVFEHLLNPLHALKNTHRILKKGGYFTMTTPNLGSYSGIVNFFLANRAQALSTDIYSEYIKLERIGHMGHVREYTINEMCDCAEKVGFALKKIEFSGPSKYRLLVKQNQKIEIDLTNSAPHLLLKARYFFKKQ
jgi:2-polyprenyl-3-methyl-5-hydroxy-6-metoxy-1,4-benzoquinol methylase